MKAIPVTAEQLAKLLNGDDDEQPRDRAAHERLMRDALYGSVRVINETEGTPDEQAVALLLDATCPALRLLPAPAARALRRTIAATAMQTGEGVYGGMAAVLNEDTLSWAILLAASVAAAVAPAEPAPAAPGDTETDERRRRGRGAYA